MIYEKIISVFLVFILCLSIIQGYADEDMKSDDITVMNDGKILENGVDYYLTYENNINIGTAKVIVNFIGNYSGIQERTFNIVRKKSSGSGSRIVSVPAATATPMPITVISTQGPTKKTEHTAYIEGYNGLFRPESNMTRAEAATIFARLISERNNEEIGIAASKFKDVDSLIWYSSYIAYLEKYDVIFGYNDSTFRPDNLITRAEFAVMCTRFYELFGDISASEKNVFF